MKRRINTTIIIICESICCALFAFYLVVVFDSSLYGCFGCAACFLQAVNMLVYGNTKCDISIRWIKKGYALMIIVSILLMIRSYRLFSAMWKYDVIMLTYMATCMIIASLLKRKHNRIEYAIKDTSIFILLSAGAFIISSGERMRVIYSIMFLIISFTLLMYNIIHVKKIE